VEQECNDIDAELSRLNAKKNTLLEDIKRIKASVNQLTNSIVVKSEKTWELSAKIEAGHGQLEFMRKDSPD